MRFIKSISLFISFGLLIFLLGFVIGCRAYQLGMVETGNDRADISNVAENLSRGETVTVSVKNEKTCATTKYIIQEYDMLRDILIEKEEMLPDRYVGMDREQLDSVLATLNTSPPLEELKKGFQSMNLISFSRDKVIVSKNYNYVSPQEEFYLYLYNNEVYVFLHDQKTLYLKTGIKADELTEEVRIKLIDGICLLGEKNLYDFLETYSS